MDCNPMYKVNGSRYIIEVLPNGDTLIWDASGVEALEEWIAQGMPMLLRPPFPIAASGLSEEEAFDWLVEHEDEEERFVPVTRIQ